MNRREWIKLTGLLSSGLMFQPTLRQPTLASLLGGENATLKRSDFGPDFEWGVATAAFQTEGAWLEDGKGMSIWDKFTHTQGKIKYGENAEVATDFYHRYKEDIRLAKVMNFKIFRFSLAWSRIVPQGTGEVNQKGIDFYHNVIDYCLELGLTPWATIYHWDLPQALQERGGWENRDILYWFSDYANLVTKEYGDKVKNWIVLNEPMAFVGLGYMTGYHAPGETGITSFLKAAHHATLCQADGGRIVRANVSNSHVGTTFSCSQIDPKRQKPIHQKAAERMDAVINRLFIEPAVGLGYPVDAVPALEMIEKYYETGDEDRMKFDFDFIGVQNYFRVVAEFSLFPPFLFANDISAEKRDVPVNEMGYEIYPEGIYTMLKKFGTYPDVKEVYVTENGVCLDDELENGQVHDPQRIEFFKDYLAQVLKAKQEGINVKGYLVWTLTDNFEWSEGYKPRFGLVYVDFKTQERIIKESGYWFQQFLEQD